MAESNILREVMTGIGPVPGLTPDPVPSAVVFQVFSMIERSAALIAAYDPDDRLRFSNAAFREILSVPAKRQPGKKSCAATMRRGVVPR